MCWSMTLKATGLRERRDIEKRAGDRGLGWSTHPGTAKESKAWRERRNMSTF